MRRARPLAERLQPLAPGFGNRVAAAARLVGDYKAAAASMGLTDEQLRKIIAERSVPNFPSIVGLAQRSRCSLVWLAFATGPQISTEKSFSESATPYAADTASVVHIQSIDGLRTYQFTRDLFQNLTLPPPAQLGVLNAPGNAMEPTISRDDVLIIDLQATRTIDGEIFVFEFSSDRVVRRTQREPDGTLVLRADNPNFEAMRLSEQAARSAKVIGRVVWTGGPI